jgi:amino acid permease
MLRFIAILIGFIFILYIGVAIPQVHPKKYIQPNDANRPFLYGADLTLVSLQFSAFIYFGLEIIPLVSDEVKEATIDTPRAMVSLF